MPDTTTDLSSTSILFSLRIDVVSQDRAGRVRRRDQFEGGKRTLPGTLGHYRRSAVAGPVGGSLKCAARIPLSAAACTGWGRSVVNMEGFSAEAFIGILALVGVV